MMCKCKGSRDEHEVNITACHGGTDEVPPIPGPEPDEWDVRYWEALYDDQGGEA